MGEKANATATVTVHCELDISLLNGAVLQDLWESEATVSNWLNENMLIEIKWIYLSRVKLKLSFQYLSDFFWIAVSVLRRNVLQS